MPAYTHQADHRGGLVKTRQCYPEREWNGPKTCGDIKILGRLRRHIAYPPT